MITEESLRKDVLEYLRTNYSIKLDIPVFRRPFSDTISLRLFRSPLGQSINQNRYMLLIRQSQDLLKKNIINTDKIKQFGEHFFQTVTQDILVLQGNEQIRKGFARMRDQIIFRVEELGLEQKAIEQECRAINDKQEILTFLEGSFRVYLSQVTKVSEQYQAVNSIQVFTSINIDSLYSQRLGNEEDYLQHYQPLLEVMQRLKSNMVKLYQQLNRCEYFELPLKSVNFLANCKNLLLELEPFLIKNDCVFNRLIFNVVRGQKQNNRLIGRVFYANTAFSNDIISDIFKAFFLSHIFKDHYRVLSAKIEEQKNLLKKHFEVPSINSDVFYGQVLKTEKTLSEVKAQIEQIKKVIGMGKDKIMRAYLGRKQCKKLGLLVELEHGCVETIKFARKMLGVLKFKSKLQFMKQKVEQAQRHAKKTMAAIKQQQGANIKPTQANLKQLNDKIESRFKESYLLIQQGLLQLNQVRESLTDNSDETASSYFSEEFFPSIEKGLKEIRSRYMETETDLLNSYEGLRKQKNAKTGEAKLEINAVFDELTDYFQSKITGQMGHQIRNEDHECEQVKDNIIKIEKVQFLMNSYVSGFSKEEEQELLKYKTNLECLLQVFEGSMDEKILQNFMEKLNFQASDWSERVKKVRELVRELNRYVSTLKKGLMSDSKKYLPKVAKLIKNRTQLYQVIQDMYQQFLLIYETCKANSHLNPSDHGLKLFDEASYKYVLMLYQYRNRTRAETEELKDLLLPKRTLNYLLDDIYEPFILIFGNYVGYTEAQLLNFTLRLQHALNFKLSQTQIVLLYQQTLSRPYSAQFFPNVKKLSEQLVQLRQQNQKVLELQKEEVVIYNLKQFKDRTLAIEEHVKLAEAVLRGLTEKDLRLEVELQNRLLLSLREKLIGDWQDNRQSIEKSLVVSRIDDFSHNDQ